MKSRLTPSHIALLFVLVVVGGSFAWWAKSRPSFLLFQAHSGGSDQAAVIHEYQRLLKRKDLPKDKEIEYRKALGEFYVRAIQETRSYSVFVQDPSVVDHPYLKSAKEQFDRILELDPNDSQGHYFLGRVFLLRQMESYAMEEFEKSRRLGPHNPDPAYFLSLIYQEREEPLKARELAEQALAIAPHSDDARMALVEAYRLSGDFQQAFKEFELLSPAYRAIPLTRARHAYFLSQQNYWDQARSEIKDALAADPGNGWIKVINAQLLMEQGRFTQAGGELAQAEGIMPKNPWPLPWHVKAWAALGRCEESSRASQFLIEALPRWPWSFWAGAHHQLCQGRELAALSSLDEALRLAPDFSAAHQMKAQILADKGQYEELGRMIRPLLDKKLHESLGYVFLAQSFYEQGKTDLALDSAEEAIRSDSRNAWAFVWLALARLQKGDKDAGLRALNEGLRMRPFDEDLIAMEALFRSRADGEETFSTLYKKIEEQTRNANVWLALGEVEKSKGHTPEAIWAYQRALELRPYLLKAQLGLVTLYSKSGEKDKASAALKKAFEINPKSSAVLEWRKKI